MCVLPVVRMHCAPFSAYSYQTECLPLAVLSYLWQIPFAVYRPMHNIIERAIYYGQAEVNNHLKVVIQSGC